MNINYLPDDILLEILEYVSQTFLITCIQLVCRRWQELTFSPPLWRNLSLYSSSPFVSNLSESNEKCRQSFIDKIGHNVLQLRTRVPFFWTRFDPSAFSGLKCLYIRMYETDTTQQIDDIINCFKSVESFKLDISSFSGLNEIITACKRLTSLKKFHLRHFFCNHSPQLKLMPHAFQVLFQKTNLTHVYVSCGDIHLDAAVQTLMRENRRLVELDLSRCSGITSAAFSNMVPCLSLRSLKLCRTGVDDEALRFISENAPNLITLSINRCNKVSDVGLMYICRGCKFLQDILISNEFSVEADSCRVTHSGVQRLADECKDLRTIQMNSHGSTMQIDASVLTSFGKLCTELQLIEIFSCKSLDDNCLSHISDLFRTLRVINFSDCPSITGLGVSKLLFRCIWLKKATFKSCSGIQTVSFILNEGDEDCSHTSSQLEDCDVLDGTTEVQVPSRLFMNENAEHRGTIENHSHVNILNFRFCDGLDVISHLNISQFCLDLVELYITGWFKNDPDQAMVALSQRCRNLRVLECTGIVGEEETNFTDVSLQAMAEYGHCLKRLGFVQNKFISISGVRQLIQNCKNLNEISVHLNESCTLSDQDVQSLTTEFSVPKIGVHKYNGLTTTCCSISIQQY